MMEDTPSNYNIANGRLEGKSMGLKAILLYAKNQGIELGQTNPLPNIEEERNRDSSGERRGWGNINQPMNQVDDRQIPGAGDTIEQNDSSPRGGKAKKPGVNKQFDEDGQAITPLRKNNFI